MLSLCCVISLSVFNPMKYDDCILHSVLLRLTHTCPFLLFLLVLISLRSFSFCLKNTPYFLWCECSLATQFLFLLEACFHDVWNSGLVVVSLKTLEIPIYGLLPSVLLRSVYSEDDSFEGHMFFSRLPTRGFSFVFGFLQFHRDLCRCGFLLIY